MQPITISIPDAVKVSGLSRSRIYIALKSKEIAARKVGRRTLIDYASLENYLASRPAYEPES